MYNVEFGDPLLRRLLHHKEDDVPKKEQVHAFDKQFNISRQGVDEAEEIPSL